MLLLPNTDRMPVFARTPKLLAVALTPFRHRRTFIVGFACCATGWPLTDWRNALAIAPTHGWGVK